MNANEIRAEVGRLNNAIVLWSGAMHEATAVGRYGTGRNATRIIGYTYTVRIDGVVYTGKAKGPQASITLRAAK